MRVPVALTVVAAVLALAASVHLTAQTRGAGAQTGDRAWAGRTLWGDPDMQGEWTSEGEYGVPLERPAQFGTRQFLSDQEYAKRLEDVRSRDERDLARVDVLSGKVEGANAPIPHWREYNTTSRRTSLIVDPPDGRLPARTAQARPVPVQRCGSLQRGEPCDSYEDYGLGVRCIVHGGGFPDAMFPAVYNANMRIVQSPGLVAITYELIHDTRVIRLDAAAPPAPLLSPAIRMYMGAARGRWEGSTLVVETTNLKAGTRGASSGLRLIERFTRTGQNAMDYRVTFVDPATWTMPWTAALDLRARPDDAGVFEYACHEGNYGMANMLSTSRLLERTGGEPARPPR
ncbi:MAG TPA: hypothetical protein VGQ37_06885 [Vicinamibacterales bacterium]|jgi:hypothetical protein|nr:hypothetical protein [Vicinamibacterales bacterium]